MSKGKHYLICGGNKNSLETILEQMTNEALGERIKPITILHPKEEDKEYISDRFSMKFDISFVVGSMVDDDDLKRANILEAQAILILPTESNNEHPDNAVLFCAKAIDTFFNNNSITKIARPSIVVKIEDPLNALILKGYANQIICSTKRDFQLAAGALFNEGLTDVYNHLMQISSDTNEIYIVDMPEVWVGKWYIDVAKIILEETHSPENPITLIGIRRRDGDNYINSINPSNQKSRFSSLGEGDKLIVLARECPDHVISELAKNLE